MTLTSNFTQELKSPFINSISSGMDPAEFISPRRRGREIMKRFDNRSDKKLKEAIFDMESGMERERAIWEYANRHNELAIPILQDVMNSEKDPSIRWTTLWAVQKFCGVEGLSVISKGLYDENEEVRSWSNLFLYESTGEINIQEQRNFDFNPKNPFDQTLPLEISGYARTLVPEMGWVQATLSPKWFESIMGRVMACTRQATFDNKLIIEKEIKNFYDDGTNYYEIYDFTGHSFAIDKNLKKHCYHGISNHLFYPSGKVGLVRSEEEKPISDMVVNVGRTATTASNNYQIETNNTKEITAGKKVRRIVNSVRGTYSGNAYVNTERLFENNMRIGSGEVQLTDMFHLIGMKLTNTYLFGTFKGKLSDRNNNNMLDVNTIPCHGTIDGKLDYALTGSPSEDPHLPTTH